MSDLILLDGHGYSWRHLCALRRQQLEERKAAQARQLTLFELKDDNRPAAERTASGRYQQPTLLDRMCKG